MAVYKKRNKQCFGRIFAINCSKKLISPDVLGNKKKFMESLMQLRFNIQSLKDDCVYTSDILA